MKDAITQAEPIVLDDDGTCPKGCAMCAAFQLELSNWLHIRRMESQ